MRLIQTSGKKQGDSVSSPFTYNAAANFTPGNDVVIAVSHFATSSNRITGITASGTAATKVVDVTDSTSGLNHFEIWIAKNVAGGSTAVQLTSTSGTNYYSLSFEEWTGVSGSTEDTDGTTAQTTSSAPSATTAAGISAAGSLIYAGFTDYIGTSWTSSTPPSGYTETFEETDGTVHEAGSAAYKIRTTTGTETATFATGSSMSWIAAIAAFLGYRGAHSIDYDFLAAGGSSCVTPAVTTEATGSSFLVCVGRGTLSDHASNSVTDSKSNTYSQLTVDGSTTRAYTDWPTSGTSLYAALNGTGGSSHTFTVAKPDTSDEVTVLAVEVPGYTTIEDSSWIEDTTGPTNVSGSVTTAGAAMLVSFWWGDDVNGEANPRPESGWTLLEHTSSLASNHVQGAVAVREVTTGGTYTCTWTPGTSQGAQMYMVALSAGGAPTVAQSHFRWRNDDGSETTATWVAAEDTNVTIAALTPKRLRVEITATNDPASAAYKLQYRKVGDTYWRDVN